MKKILLITNELFFITNFREEFVRGLLLQGHQVFLAYPRNLHQKANQGLALIESGLDLFQSLGVEFHHIHLSRKSLNPWQELKTFFSIRQVIKDIGPDIVINYTIKPSIYGSLAAKSLKIPKIFSMITGLGHIFTETSLKKKILKRLISLQYKLALASNRHVFFQNPDDSSLFTQLGLVRPHQITLTNGSGVNLQKFSPNRQEGEKQSFLLVGRMLWDKGIGEYVEAAKIVKNKYPTAKFYLLGPLDVNPAAITLEKIQQWEQEGIIHYWGSAKDVRPFLQKVAVFVLPSYREGTPRSSLEAMAMGLPIITTDVPGCRETVVEGVNGLLVPHKNAPALAKAMERMLDQEDWAKEMGKRGRIMAEERFDVNKVNEGIYQKIFS